MGEERGCSLFRIINFVLSLVFLAAGGYMIWYFLGKPDVNDVKDAWGNLGDFSDVLGNLSNIDFGDMYAGDPKLSDNTTDLWPTDGTGGLNLEVLNALDDTWQKEFTQALSDWENGTPDALTLTITQGEVDYECSQVDGLMKVCNGNFGDTGWLGINEILTSTRDGLIQSSVAKMNEYYLRNAEYDERRYTMCHEVGHGFGLPHTDESFTNADLGNCLDYSSNPSNNLLPGTVNYKRLASMYGTVDGSRRLRRERSSSRSSDRRILSEDLRLEYHEAIAEIEQLAVRRGLREGDLASLWEMIEDSPRGSSYARSLGDDFEIQVYVLHTLPKN